MTATSAETIPDPVEPAAVETSVASDETVFAEAGLAASSRLRAKGKMVAVCPTVFTFSTHPLVANLDY